MKTINTAHLFFEQSGTFKREFRNLGIEAYDYDIQNQYGETDYIIDLFAEFGKAFEGGRASLTKSTRTTSSSLFSRASTSQHCPRWGCISVAPTTEKRLQWRKVVRY